MPGNYRGSEYLIDVLWGAKLYYVKPFSILKIHKETQWTEVCRSIIIGVFKHKNNFEWVAPTFTIPKKNGIIHLIFDFRELNKRIKRKPFPIPKIQHLWLKLVSNKYATSLD